MALVTWLPATVRPPDVRGAGRGRDDGRGAPAPGSGGPDAQQPLPRPMAREPVSRSAQPPAGAENELSTSQLVYVCGVSICGGARNCR